MNDLNNIIENFPHTSIAVIGDLCLDMYYFLSDERKEVSVETGIETCSVSSFKHEAGGAGNVAINLKTLGASSVDMYGVIGGDPFGNILKAILEESGINCKYIQTQKSEWKTHVYHKVYKDSKEEPRFDIGNFNIVNSHIVKSLLNDLESNIDNYQAIIINEQIIHGYHNELFQTGLLELIEKHEDKCLWISDCRHLNNVYKRTIRKLNIHEAGDIYRNSNKNDKIFPNNNMLIKWLHSYWKTPVVITLGEEGAIGISRDGKINKEQGINLIGKIDTVGAGDAFLSGLTLSLATGSPLKEALHMGNLSANVSVTKLFETGHPTTEEVLKMGTSPDYRYNPELAKDIRKATFLKDTHIELIDLKKGGFPRVVIFDHDGTISTLRQGWEPIMKKVSLSAILGNSLNTVSMEELGKIDAAVTEMIEKTTGIQTIIQMHHLRDMVISFGYVSAREVLTPREYKSIYNEKLLEMVSGRVELFKKGLLNLNDVTMKGVLQFLEVLKEKNILIYLASGTDQEDVRKEASILGYNSYFNGGIFGSVGNVSMDPKRIVIENIVKDLPSDIKPEDCYVFGDGPVEMREAAKRGFTRIGLVSDEKQRFGINPEKRSRLILGGAQVLIPDFSWIPSLAEYLEWEA